MSAETTVDSVCRGALVLEQPREGYRFNIDPLLLADFAATRVAAPDRIVDLGAGVGIVGMLLALRFPRARVLLVELQVELAELAAANVLRNGLGDRVEARCLDLRQAERWSPPAGERTLLVSNPPFFRADAGRPSRLPQVSIAKHEVACTLHELLLAVASGLHAEDELALIYPRAREDELLRGLVDHGLAPVGVRRVHPLPDRPPARTLVLARRALAEVGALPEAEPPLVVEEEPGRYTPEVQRMLEPIAAGPVP